MTMHKSKGLEFPIVILMNTAAKYNERDTKDKLQFEESLGVGVDIFNKEVGLTYPSIIKQAIKAKTKKTLRAEALRLLYVAFTRAKEKLIIYGTVPCLDKYLSKLMDVRNKETSELVASSYDSHLKCILQIALAKENTFDIKLHKASELVVNNSQQDKLDRNKSKLEALREVVDKFDLKENREKVESLKEQFVIIKPVANVNKKYTVTELKGADLNLSDMKPESINTKVTGTTYGTFIHSVIEHLDYNNITNESVLLVVESIAKALRMQDKINTKYVVQDIMNMYGTLKEYLIDAKCIKNELEFVIEDSLEDIAEANFKTPALIQGVVDMYIVTRNNNHIIIDFKTDKVDSEQELLDRYNVQLKVYKKAIELAYNEKVDNTFIYSFGLGKVIKVDE